MCRWFESNRGSQKRTGKSRFSFFEVRKDGQKSAAPPAGPERRLLATVRWTVATAVALPQQSESNMGSQKENWEVPVLFFCGQASYWLPDLRVDEGRQPLHAGRDFFILFGYTTDTHFLSCTDAKKD